MELRDLDGMRPAELAPEEELARLSPAELTERLRALRDVTDAALANVKLEALLQQLLKRIRDALATDTATVLLCTEDPQTLEVRASLGLEEEVERHPRIPVGKGVAGVVAHDRRAVIIDDLDRLEVVSPLLRKLRSMMLVPLVVEEQLLGVLHVGSVAPRRFTSAELALLRIVGERVALALERQRLYEAVQRRLEAGERRQAALAGLGLQALRSPLPEVLGIAAQTVAETLEIERAAVLELLPGGERLVVRSGVGWSPEVTGGLEVEAGPGSYAGYALGSSEPVVVADAERETRFRLPELLRGEGATSAIGVAIHGARRPFGILVAQPAGERELTVEDASFVQGVANVLSATVQREELQRDEQQARGEAALALRAKSDFLAVMSHELRTPLAAVMGYAELLRLGIPVPIPPEAAQQVERIEYSARHLLQLIEEILSFSRAETGHQEVHRTSTDLREAVAEAVRQQEPGAERKNLTLRTALPEHPVEVCTDAEKFREIVTHLLSNAVKFTREGEVEVRLERDGSDVVLRVCDTGIGVAPEHREQIFEPFWQVNQGSTREAGGMGLGLAIARRLASLLGGELRVETGVGRGSTFLLRLPAD